MTIKIENKSGASKTNTSVDAHDRYCIKTLPELLKSAAFRSSLAAEFQSDSGVWQYYLSVSKKDVAAASEWLDATGIEHEWFGTGKPSCFIMNVPAKKSRKVAA